MKNKTEWRLAFALCVLLLAGTAVLLAGCGGTEVAPTAPPATNTVPPPTPSPTAPADTPTPEADGTPADTLATSGEEVYAAECAECHGEQGEGLIGPALIGDRAKLANYGTAQGVYDYVHTTMPQDAPGSLTDQQYLEVVSFLLLQNAFIQGNTPISEEGLGDISLQ